MVWPASKTLTGTIVWFKEQRMGPFCRKIFAKVLSDPFWNSFVRALKTFHARVTNFDLKVESRESVNKRRRIEGPERQAFSSGLHLFIRHRYGLRRDRRDSIHSLRDVSLSSDFQMLKLFRTFQLRR